MDKVCIKCWIEKSKDNFSKNWKYIKNTCKDCINEYSRNRHEINKDEINKKHREYYINNRSNILERLRNYHNNNPHIAKAKKARRRTRIWVDDWTITREWLDNIYSHQLWKCVYCNSELSGVKCHLDHIFPLSRWWLHTINNVQWLCSNCNLSKWAKTHDEFISYLKKHGHK